MISPAAIRFTTASGSLRILVTSSAPITEGYAFQKVAISVFYMAMHVSKVRPELMVDQ